MIKIFKKFFLIFLLSFLGIICFFVFLTFFSHGQKDTKEEMEVYLSSSDIHVGLVLPLKNAVFDWRNFLNSPDNLYRNTVVTWVEFGWGSKRFYFEMPTWDKFSLSLAFDALFLSEASVMHVDFLDQFSMKQKNLRPVKISFQNYLLLVKAIQDEFSLRDGKAIFYSSFQYGAMDRFYEAKKSYSYLRTCNVWTSDMLAVANLPHPIWSPSKYGLEWIYGGRNDRD